MLIKNPYLHLLIFFIIISLYFLFFPIFSTKSGVVVTHVDKGSKCNEVEEGKIITQVSGKIIKNKIDFDFSVQELKEGEYAAMVINGGPGGCVALKDGYIGVGVEDIPSKFLKFGLDLQGGKTFILKIENDKNKIIETIEKRIYSLRIPETKIYSYDKKIGIATIFPEKIGLLILSGKFEAKIASQIELEEGVGEIKIGNKTYEIKVENNNLILNNTFFKFNETFQLDEIEFEFKNVTNNSISFEAKFFENEDVERVFSSIISYNQNFGVYEFNIPVKISENASKRFSKITRGLKTSYAGGNVILDGFLVYYLDGEEISRLNIPFQISGKEINNIGIVGFKTKKEDALNEKTKIQMILESGRIQNLSLIGTEPFEPKNKIYCFGIIILGALSSFVFLISQIYFRYKTFSFLYKIIFLLILEIVCILGIATITQTFFSIGWIVDFYSIIGLSSFIFISSYQFTIITRENKGEKLNLKYKSKNLIKMINFTTFISILFSSILLFTNFRGIGISVIFGLIIGIITKQVYKEIIK